MVRPHRRGAVRTLQKSSAMMENDGAKTGVGSPPLCVAPNAHFLPKSRSEKGAPSAGSRSPTVESTFHSLFPEPPLTILLSGSPGHSLSFLPKVWSSERCVLIHRPRHGCAAGGLTAGNAPPSGAQLQAPRSREES